MNSRLLFVAMSLCNQEGLDTKACFRDFVAGQWKVK